MYISKLIKDLKEIQKKHGDLDIYVHALEFKKHYEGGEEFALEDMELKVDKVPRMNMDTSKISKRKYKTLVIRPYDYNE